MARITCVYVPWEYCGNLDDLGTDPFDDDEYYDLHLF